MQSTSAYASESRYFQALAEGRFELPKCDDCERFHYYPRIICPYCGSRSLTWQKPSGLGCVYSTTTVRRKDDTYNVCLVDLDDGPRMMSTVLTSPVDAVHIGMRVRAHIEEPLLVVFTPIDEA